MAWQYGMRTHKRKGKPSIKHPAGAHVASGAKRTGLKKLAEDRETKVGKKRKESIGSPTYVGLGLVAELLALGGGRVLRPLIKAIKGGKKKIKGGLRTGKGKETDRPTGRIPKQGMSIDEEIRIVKEITRKLAEGKKGLERAIKQRDVSRAVDKSRGISKKPKMAKPNKPVKQKGLEYYDITKDPKMEKELGKKYEEAIKKVKYEEAVAKHLPDHKWNRSPTKKKGIQIKDGLDIDYKKKGGKLKKKTEKELMQIVLKNLKASDKVKTMYKKEGGGIKKLPKDSKKLPKDSKKLPKDLKKLPKDSKKLPKDSWKKGEDYYPPEWGRDEKKKLPEMKPLQKDDPLTKGVAPKSKKKGKKKLRVAPIPKKKPPMSFNQRVDKQLKKRMDEFTKKSFERKQYEEDKEGGWYLPHPDAPVLKNIKHGGKIKYRNIGGRFSGNDIIKKIYD